MEDLAELLFQLHPGALGYSYSTEELRRGIYYPQGLRQPSGSAARQATEKARASAGLTRGWGPEGKDAASGLAEH